MKKLLGIMVLGLLLSGNAYADDIRDFQIEEMSLGDSALKYYSENEIKTNKKNWYKSKKYSTSAINDTQVSYKSKDKQYILASIDYTETMDISKCLVELPSLADAINEMFSSKVKKNGLSKTKHWADKSKKSFIHSYWFTFPNKDKISVQCYDWSDEMTDKNGWGDHMRTSISSKKFVRFLDNE